MINAGLLTFLLVILFGWIYRNFGIIAAAVTFLLVFLSPLLVIYSGNGLWWSLWCFYLPFLVMLLLMERKNSNPEKISNKLIYFCLFLAVFIKCFFTGFEFITVPLVAIFCPVIYYYWLEKRSFKFFVLFSFKIGLIALLAVSVYMLILMVQISDLLGNYTDAWQYILDSFSRRTFDERHPAINGFFSGVYYVIVKVFGRECF